MLVQYFWEDRPKTKDITQHVAESYIYWEKKWIFACSHIWLTFLHDAKLWALQKIFWDQDPVSDKE